MSRPVADILGRMQGNVLALKGMYEKLTPVVPASNPTFEQVGPPPTMASLATHEDYTFVQKLLHEIEAQARDASAEIDKILQVPSQPEVNPERAAPKSGSSHQESGSHKK